MELSERDKEIIRTALNQRVKDMWQFADDCKKQDMGHASVAFIEMAEDAQRVLDKFSR